jgi:hypothetical protein
MAAVEPTTMIFRTDRQVSCEIDEEIVLMSLDHDEFYALNPTASAIWHLTEPPRRFERLVDELVGRFDVDRATCDREVRVVLDQMVERGIVETGEDRR